MSQLRHQVNQKRIAEQAGVSQSTVSLVLSGRRVSSDETSQRVLKAAERLRYRPNLLVRGIQTGKTRMIGVMMPPFDFYWSEVLYGIHDVLTDADHVPITLWTVHTGAMPRQRNAPGDELLQIHRLLDRRVDGVIGPRCQAFSEHVNEFSSRNLPVVTIDHELPPEYNADYVGSDEASGGRMAANIYTIRGIGALDTLRVRRSPPGLCRGAGVRGCGGGNARSELHHSDGHGSPNLGIEQARAMLSRPDRPSAVFASTDLYAKVVYQAAKELNLSIPGDLAVVGFWTMTSPWSCVRR